MLIGSARVSKAGGSQSLDLQRDALRAAGVDAVHVYHDFASGVRDDRPGLDSCVCTLRTGDVLTGQGAQIDTTAAAGRLVFGTFAALAEFERELIRERTLAWLTAALYIGSVAWTVKMEIPA